MKLSIITINRNNAAGLEKTLNSVFSQTCKGLEHVIVDGASTDDSVEVIKRYVEKTQLSNHGTPYPIKWISESDNGIYNAMNKGIMMAEGEYVQILNSGDCLANDFVVERMFEALQENLNTDFLFGNMIKVWPDGLKLKCVGAEGPVNMTMIDFYEGTLDHDGAFIKRRLYDNLGFYDESLKICSDWKWVMNAVVFNQLKPIYVNIDTILFDMTGVSENEGKQRETIMTERDAVLKRLLPENVIADYKMYATDIIIMKRIHKNKFAYKIVRFIERCLFKIEKLRNRKSYCN